MWEMLWQGGNKEMKHTETHLPVGDGWMNGLGWKLDREIDAEQLLWNLERWEGLHWRYSWVGGKRGRGGMEAEEIIPSQRHWRYYSMFRMLKDNSFQGKTMTLCKYEINACQRFLFINDKRNRCDNWLKGRSKSRASRQWAMLKQAYR